MSKLFSYLSRYVRGLGFRQGLAALVGTYRHRPGLRAIPRDAGKSIWLRNNPADRSVFRHVFIDSDYDTTGWRQYVWLRRRYEGILAAARVPVIVDAGANIGLATVWFSERFPRARVYAVEPVIGKLSVLAQNAVGRPITPVAGAVWDKAMRLRIGNADAASDAFRVIEGDGDLRAYGIAEIADIEPQGGLFLVKVDIEGGEAALFRSNTACMESVALIIIEPHDGLYPGEGVTLSFRRRIAELPIDLVMRGESLFCFASERPSRAPV